MWDSIKITPVNSTIGYSLTRNTFFYRKLSGIAIKYILKKTFATLRVNARYHEQTFALHFLKKHIPDHASVLDIGSSESDFPLLLHASDYEVTAFDQRDYPFTRSVKGDASLLDTYFPSSQFDAITVISTIEHIGLGAYGDPQYETSYGKLIHTWKNLLKDQGVMILSLPVTSESLRKEKGQWVENIHTFRNMLKELPSQILDSRLVVYREELPQKWEVIPETAEITFHEGVYMAAIQF